MPTIARGLMQPGIFCRSKTNFMEAINILQHSNNIPEKSQRFDNNQDSTSATHLFLLAVVFSSSY